MEILETTNKTTYLANIGEWKERRDHWKGTMAPSTVTRDTYFFLLLFANVFVFAFAFVQKPATLMFFSLKSIESETAMRP